VDNCLTPRRIFERYPSRSTTEVDFDATNIGLHWISGYLDHYPRRKWKSLLWCIFNQKTHWWQITDQPWETSLKMLWKHGGHFIRKMVFQPIGDSYRKQGTLNGGRNHREQFFNLPAFDNSLKSLEVQTKMSVWTELKNEWRASYLQKPGFLDRLTSLHKLESSIEPGCVSRLFPNTIWMKNFDANNVTILWRDIRNSNGPRAEIPQ